jgi:tetratricopeptide (TPR) repeat protein
MKHGWALGEPDLIVKPARPYQLPSGHGEQHDDVFRNLVIGVEIPATRFVRAVEFRPGDAPVHHAVIHIDRTSASRRRDGSDGAPGFDGMGAREAQLPDGHFLGWAPGRGPIVAPEGMPWRLDPGTDLVAELHLMPGAQTMAVQPEVGLYFTERPAVHMPAMFKMGSKAIDIPAGEANYVVTDSFELPIDVELLSVYPHAHYLATDMRVLARLPSGQTRSLLHIKRWSFRWQQDYRYVTPVPLPRRTVIDMRFTYDNSASNPDNPHKPPRAVMAGQRSTDEMGNLGLQVRLLSPLDRVTLQRATAAHDARANVAGAEMLVRHNPDNAENQTFLGGSYVDVGRVADAMPHLLRAISLDPRSSNAYNELGGALLAQSRELEAVKAFERAAALAPADDRMHFNLASVLMRLGRITDAERAFRRSLALNPESADAHGELGVLLFSTRRVADAIVHLSRAVELDPESARLHSDLGGAMAQAGRWQDALRHTQRALAIDPTYAAARENLPKLERRLARGERTRTGSRLR